MNYHFAIVILFFSFSLFAQEKGVSPLQERKGGETAETYAVVVGISDYQDEGIPDLRFADKDAEAFAGFLQSPAGGSLDEDHLKVLLNEKATVAQFAIALDWLMEVATENDKVVIYFSGHGDVERRTLTQPGFLLCWDAPSRVYMAGGALALPMLQEVISTLSIQNKSKVVVVTDACRSGKLSGSKVGGAQLTNSNLAKQYANEIKILSCQPDEYSIEGEQWGGGRGAFSYHLLDGLSGMADRNNDESVNLMEIRGYLEEKVSTEVAPQNQLPMVVGNGREKLADIFPEILSQIKAGKKGQLQLFTAIELRGIEDEVLAVADSNIVEMYLAFQKALVNKAFLEPATACADYYYEKLSREPQLEPLHSSMRRNYAAALQDDAQQALNTLLKSGLTELVLKGKTAMEVFGRYPAYLDRAANLLGKGHYMYTVLLARKNFFLGRTSKDKNQGRQFYRKALNLQPDMGHAMVEIIRSSDVVHLDSVNWFFEKATQLFPSWIEPYLAKADFYNRQLNDLDKVKEMLNVAERIDSNSILVMYRKAMYFVWIGDNEKADQYFSQAAQANAKGEICFPCLYNDIGHFNARRGEYQKAAIAFEKLSSLDSSFKKLNLNLCFLYYAMDNFKAMESPCLESFKRWPDAGYYLAEVYMKQGRLNEADELLTMAIKKDALSVQMYALQVALFYKKGEMIKADSILKKMMLISESIEPADMKRNRLIEHSIAAQELEKLKYYEAVEILYLKILSGDAVNMAGIKGLSKLYVILEKKAALFNLLESSIAKGLNIKLFEEDPDFESVRRTKEWKAIKKQHADRNKD